MHPQQVIRLKLTGRELVKLGELYRQNGVYNGRSILNESLG
jgi:hypothetical protein